MNAVTTACLPARACSARKVRLAGLSGLVSVLLASPALAAGQTERPLPQPSKYNTPPASCSPSSVSASRPVCGPWDVPWDPNNAFSASKTEYGVCEYWAAEERPDILNDMANSDSWAGDGSAPTWIHHAQAEGLAIDGTPHVGDIAVWDSQQDVYGAHLAYVAAVDSDGSIVTTGMNLDTYGRHGYTQLLLAKPWQSPTYDGWQGLKFIHRYYAPGVPHTTGPPGGGPTGPVGRREAPGRRRSPHLKVLRVHRSGRYVTITVSVSSRARGQVSFLVVHLRSYKAHRVRGHRGRWRRRVMAARGTSVVITFAGRHGWRSKTRAITV